MFAEIPWLLRETPSKKHSRVRRRWYHPGAEFSLPFCKCCPGREWNAGRWEELGRNLLKPSFTPFYKRSPSNLGFLLSTHLFLWPVAVSVRPSQQVPAHPGPCTHACSYIRAFIISVTSRVTLGISINSLPTCLFLLWTSDLNLRGHKMDAAKLSNTDSFNAVPV